MVVHFAAIVFEGLINVLKYGTWRMVLCTLCIMLLHHMEKVFVLDYGTCAIVLYMLWIVDVCPDVPAFACGIFQALDYYY